MKQHLPLTILLALGLLIGMLTLTHYGESWDERKLYDYAADSLDGYRTWFQHGTIPVTGDRFENYGPFFVMVTRLVTKAFTRLFPNVLEVDVQHFIYLLTFLVGLWAFYRLALRLMGRHAAFGATALFMSQPVLWGHAFINPKDIPLLSFFLLSVYLGLRMHDALFEADSRASDVSRAWRQSPPRTRRLLIWTGIVWLTLLVILFGGTGLIHQWIEGAVRGAAENEASLIAQLVPRVQRVAPEVYIERFFVLFLRARAAAFLAITGLSIWLARRHLPGALQALRAVLPAGIILGLTISIRIFGVWAGALVAGHLIWKAGRKAWPALAAYGLTAVIVMYITWPYLWADPAGHFLETILIMAQHPWPSSVLFNGASYPANDLPASYLPLLLGIQLTEPVWPLFFIGLGGAVFRLRRDRADQREWLILALVWLLVPLVVFIILRPTLYDNFRQVFFILPPVFLLAGLAYDCIRRPAVQAILIVLVVLPGVAASARLHPYEYVYYNSFIGGTDAAVDRFELEYWATSYREAAREANRLAPPNANVWVDGPAHLFNRFARPDFHIYSPQEAERADRYDLVVTLARYDLEKTSFPEAEIVYTVVREGAVFAVVRRP